MSFKISDPKKIQLFRKSVMLIAQDKDLFTIYITENEFWMYVDDELTQVKS